MIVLKAIVAFIIGLWIGNVIVAIKEIVLDPHFDWVNFSGQER